MPAANGSHHHSNSNSSLTISNRSFLEGATINGSPGGNTSVSASWTVVNSIASSAAERDAQLKDLTDQLNHDIMVKEGAEAMLQEPLTGSLRTDVEQELAIAKERIVRLQRTIDTYNARDRDRKRTNDARPRRKFAGAPLNETANWVTNWKTDGTERDDFRSTMHQANSAIKALLLMSKHPSHHHATSPAPSPSTSPSTSTLPNPATATEAELSRARIETMNRLIGILQKNMRVRYEIEVGEVVMSSLLPCLADKATKQARATAYRLIRHSLVDAHSVQRIGEQNLDWYIVKTLSRDNKHSVEKEQAVKLIRAVVEIGSERYAPHTAVGSGTVPLSDAVMRAMIAVAESPDDPFKSICLQTLTEIPEGPLDMAPLLTSAFLHIIDSPQTRAYLEPGMDIEIAFTGITDAYGKSIEHMERVKGCARIFSSMLRSWSGLMYCCVNDKAAIRAVVDCLRIPALETREVILDTFFHLLNIKLPEWHRAFIDGRRLTMYRKSRLSAEIQRAEIPHRPPHTLKLTDQYIALLILIFTKAGLLDALTSMFEEPGIEPALSRKATLLMAEVLQKANRVLPLSVAAKIQSLPRIFNLASDYNDNEHRIMGSSALTLIDSFNRHHSRSEPTAKGDASRPRANSVEESIRRGQRAVEQDRMKVRIQVDDRTFQANLLETQVMLTKDHTKWSYDTLLDLIEGPLHNPKRMEEAIKVLKYIRRLMSFFHPFAHRYSDLSRSKFNMRWTRIGCSLLTALLACPDGVRFLAEDEFLGQLVKSFAQLDPLNPTPTTDPIFSKERMEKTLTGGYFEMVGVLSRRKEGIELLEKFQLFTAFYHLSELRSREDLITGIVENLDYSIDGHSRIVLSKTLTSSYKHVRLYATNHLGGLIRTSQTANAWTIRLLLTQLYDPAVEVRELAVRFLEEACEATDVLQMVVEMQPTLDHLGEIGHPLLLKFMSTTVGFRFLYAASYIDREMELWFHERNLHYVVHIEVFLAKAFNENGGDEGDEMLAFDGIVPPHFYGVMAKTELGCEVLQEKGHFSEFAQFIRAHGLEQSDRDIIMKLKSVLWAVGNIGAAEGGLPFLEEEEIIPHILNIAEQSLVLSVRGTCFFVLGLISSTPQGAEILDDYNWEATLSPLGLPSGLCVPVDVEQFVSIDPWKCIASETVDDSRLIPPESEEENELMTALYNLANTVIANAASRTLTKMKSKPEYRHIFSSPRVFYRALHTISTQKYRMPVRRYIIDLFNIELDADVVQELTESAMALRMPPPEREPPAPASNGDDQDSENDSPRPPPPPIPRAVQNARESVMPFRQRSVRQPVSDSSEEEESDMEEEVVTKKRHRAPVMSLRPKSRIIGFN
ncbi:Rapamycin-insensitive companion of mTOR, middle domain-containing protein [Epithele typhae]|uniref:Rapamycin-insensitive companion of mTOR, middle domain-containing protein n=1 Tax=Epithele typhae TaxID=378194 RepID=UPI0020072A5A|nr:Rapamycin-insensitive companion of mTOR, middle domain-containing protein [Epithele typhae]KAH9912683.1 Rapamycin-insensitive companion of mTOR, middle domain-containing protein [Epithele typhae]